MKFEDISEVLDPSTEPMLDHPNISDEDFLELSDLQLQWRNNGVLILNKFLPENLISDYCKFREKVRREEVFNETPYMHYRELRELALYRPLTEILRSLLGEEPGLHLNLSGWISTERKFHADTYLNPAGVNGWYAAVWMALDDIHEDSGPFEWINGSHRWPTIRYEAIKKHWGADVMNKPDWPNVTQDWLSEIIEEKIARENMPLTSFKAKKGDVLLWHSNLIHRGSIPKDRTLLRKSLISHFSGINHRPDMPTAAQDSNGSWYFPIRQSLRPNCPPANL